MKNNGNFSGERARLELLLLSELLGLAVGSSAESEVCPD